MQWEIGVFKPNGEPTSSRDGGRAAPVTGGTSRDTTWVANTTGWHGRFNIDQTMANDYQIDRENQRTRKSFTGIRGIRQQDMAMTESMGLVMDRTNEHLGTTDAFIIRVRRKLLAEARALAQTGEVPYRVDHPEVYRQRSGEMVIPRAQDWWDAYTSLREQFNTQPQLAVTAK
jgi:hypothetical protein